MRCSHSTIDASIVDVLALRKVLALQMEGIAFRNRAVRKSVATVDDVGTESVAFFDLDRGLPREGK